MNVPRHLVIVRHGQSEGNLHDVSERVRLGKGSPDYELTELGREQAQQTGLRLRELYPGGFAGRFVSHYRRTQETMALLCPDSWQEETPWLAEANRGIFHVMGDEEVFRRMPWELERLKREGLYHYRPPGGENWLDVEQRVQLFLDEMGRRFAGQDVLAVGHNTWLNLLLKRLKRWTVADTVRQYSHDRITNCGLVVCTAQPTKQGHELWPTEVDLVLWSSSPTD